MLKQFEVRWEGELPADPDAVWDAITRHAHGYLWKIDYRLEAVGPVTYLRYRHRTEVPADDFERQLDACRRHTTFYQHSLGQYACHFAGREATYVSVEAPPHGDFAALRRALAVADGVDPVASERAWADWIAGVFESERVA